jgi:hypothetical protein
VLLDQHWGKHWEVEAQLAGVVRQEKVDEVLWVVEQQVVSEIAIANTISENRKTHAQKPSPSAQESLPHNLPPKPQGNQFCTLHYIDNILQIHHHKSCSNHNYLESQLP